MTPPSPADTLNFSLYLAQLTRHLLSLQPIAPGVQPSPRASAIIHQLQTALDAATRHLSATPPATGTGGSATGSITYLPLLLEFYDLAYRLIHHRSPSPALLKAHLLPLTISRHAAGEPSTENDAAIPIKSAAPQSVRAAAMRLLETIDPAATPCWRTLRLTLQRTWHPRLQQLTTLSTTANATISPTALSTRLETLSRIRLLLLDPTTPAPLAAHLTTLTSTYLTATPPTATPPTATPTSILFELFLLARAAHLDPTPLLPPLLHTPHLHPLSLHFFLP